MSKEEKKRSNVEGSKRCPMGSDVGPLGRSTEFVDSFVAGFIYAAAIEGLIEQTLEINNLLETMTEEGKEGIPTLKEDLADIDAKWLLATAMFSINA